MHQGSDSRCACTTLRKASRAVTRAYDEALGGTGMTIVQFSILRNIAREDGGEGLPLSRLADLLVMERTTLYRALGPLERQGWVTVRDGAGRAKLASLTPSGRQAKADATGAWKAAQKRLLGGIGLSEWQAFETMVDRLVGIATARGA